jgi:hypothetical protein
MDMDRETMEYSLNQTVAFEYIAKTRTGKIIGHSGDNFIVLLDQKLAKGESAVLVPADRCRPLVCHWCLDKRKVPAGSFTKGQADTNTIPMVDCPYCDEVAALKSNA